MGLKFLLTLSDDVLLNKDVIDELLKAILQIQTFKDQSNIDEPLSPQSKGSIDEVKQSTKEAMSPQKNLKLQDKINVYLADHELPTRPSEFDCYIKVKNYRELLPKSLEGAQQGEQYEYADAILKQASFRNMPS